MSEKKSILEIAIMPIVVAIVGISGTLLITNQQEKNAAIMSVSQLNTTKELAEADREIKILEIVSEQLTSSDLEERKTGLRLLGAVSGELAEKVARAFSEGKAEDSELKKVANQVGNAGAYRAEEKRIAEEPSAKEFDQKIAGRYFMDGRPDRVITISNLNRTEYRIEEQTSPWPWEGKAQLNGLRLSGKANFIRAKDTMRVEGFFRDNGSIVVQYTFLTDKTGNPIADRVDHHIWYKAG